MAALAAVAAALVEAERLAGKGSWELVAIGQREKGEALLAQALQRNPAEVWHYVRAAEALPGVPVGR